MSQLSADSIHESEPKVDHVTNARFGIDFRIDLRDDKKLGYILLQSNLKDLYLLTRH